MLSKKIVLLVIFYSVFVCAKANKTNSKSKEQVTSAQQIPSASYVSAKKGKIVRPYEDSNESKVDVKKTRALIEAIDLILKNDKQVEAKVDLYVKKSYLLYNVGKKIKFSQATAKDNNLTAVYMADFNQAISILDQLEALDKKKPLLKKQQKALIYFVRGSISYELNKEKQMLTEYQTSLSFDKTTPQAGSMSLIVAEYFFDHDKFDEAIFNYQQLYHLYDYQQKAIADFKTAWSYLIKKEYTKSEEYFLRSVNAQATHSLIEDSIKDLAYVSTQVRNEEQNLEFSQKNFTKTEHRAIYLLALIRHLYAIDKKKIPYKLFNEAFKINKQIKDKTQILGILISYERREYPTKGQIVAFGHLKNLVQKIKPEQVKSTLAEAKQLQNDLEYYIKIFIDGYLQKIQSRKITDRSQFSTALNSMIPFYIENFAIDTNVNTYYSLWIDIGKREENLALLDSIHAHWGSQKEKYAKTDLDSKIDNRLRVEIITLLQKESKNKPELKERLLKELIAFADRYQNDLNILPISKQISEIYLAETKYKEALPYLKIIYLKEPQVENYYNFKLASFQMGDYEAVSGDPDTKKYDKDVRILNLIRESQLKQAAYFYNKNDFSKYEESIKSYLQSKPDEKKSLIVYGDYFSKLLDQKQVEKFCSEYAAMDKKIKPSKDILKYVETTIDQILGEGSNIDCAAFEHFTESQAVNYKIILYLRSKNKNFLENEAQYLSKIEADKKRLLLGLMALTQPQDAISFFKKNPPKETEDLKIYLIALKISQKRDRPILSEADQNLLKPVLIAKEKVNPITSKLDKQIDQFFYPTKKMSMERYSKVMEDVFYRIKILRKTFIKESTLMPDDQKAQYLVKLATVENKVAQVINDSPRPAALNPEELANYNAELAKAALDYQNQAVEYLKVKDEIDKRQAENKALLEAQKVPEIDVVKWFWPSGAVTETARRLEKEKGVMAALVYLEYQRNGGKLNDSDYYILRAGLLLSNKPFEAMRNYVRDELNVAGLGTIVERWRQIK